VINGLFFTKRIDGLYRYGSEILNELDKIVPKDVYEVVLPTYADNLPEFSNLKVVKYGTLKGRLWEQINFWWYVRRRNAVSLNFCNTTPLLNPGIVCVHDLLYKVNKRYFKSLHGRLAVLWSCLNYWRIAKSKCAIITVSEYSKQQIVDVYKVDPNRITVIGNAWQHISRMVNGENTFSKYNILKKRKYFFTLASLSEYKNFKWIIEVAKKNPDCQFAIAGGKVKSSNKIKNLNNMKNIVLLGYVNDNEMVSLMKNARAFIFPSKYEGFGIPPLEAIALGTRSIVSNAACLPEIYGDSVHYIEPDDYCVNLQGLLREKVATPELILNKYSWEKSAKRMYELIKDVGKK